MKDHADNFIMAANISGMSLSTTSQNGLMYRRALLHIRDTSSVAMLGNGLRLPFSTFEARYYAYRLLHILQGCGIVLLSIISLTMVNVYNPSLFHNYCHTNIGRAR